MVGVTANPDPEEDPMTGIISLDELNNDQLRDHIEQLPLTQHAKGQVKCELDRVNTVIDARVLTGTDLDYWHERSVMLAANLADFMREHRPIGTRAWEALEAAERPLYGMGTNSYTDVTPREESGGTHIAAMWAHAEECVLQISETDPGDDELRVETARRVAYANAILVFGPEFVGLAAGGPIAMQVGDELLVGGKPYRLDQRTSSDPLGVGRSDGDRYILRNLLEGR
jgi:hypothetical protein